MKRFSIFMSAMFFLCITVRSQSPVVEWIKQPDPITGREVWQITANDSPSVAVYFERQAFTADDRYLCFGSKRSGSWQLYRVNLHSGEICLISPRKEILPFGFTIHPDGKSVCYIHNNILYQTEVTSLREKIWFDFREKFTHKVNFSSSFSADAKFTVVTTRSDTGLCIFRVNLRSGEIQHALTWKGERFSHPQICPTNPDLITFVPGPDTQNDMTLPMEKRARTWIVDMSTGQTKQFLTMPYGFRATHESWSADGKKFFFFKKTQPGWIPASICSINQDGSNWREYYTHDELRLGHGVASKDGKWFICDGQDPYHNPLILINLNLGEATFLCWPNASIEGKYGQYSHVHPSLSLSGRYVCYTSDVTGTPQVYVVPIGDLTGSE